MTLLTPWGEALDPNAVLQEYPRPQLVRDSYLNLNGAWQYAITPDATPPLDWDGEILVPFSPESPLSGVGLSGVGRQLQPTETLWYRREFTPPAGFVRDRVLLHFGAVDQTCTVTVNGCLVGTHHGGFLPFTLDVTEALAAGGRAEGGAAEIVVAVTDISDTGSHSIGKQRLKRGGIWYTAQSGIWQTVWLESLPSVAVDRLVLTPVLDESGVDVTVESAVESAADAPATVETATVEISADGVVVARATVAANTTARITLPDAREWSPEHPFLYDVVVTLGDDRVTSYFGMRSFGVGPDADGTPRLLLNGRPYFHAGILDQGYWSDGYLTPPSDAAMIYDIETAKRLGFTMLRKHIKVEPLRWYYHCDRLGMLVWQDMINGGSTYNPLVVTAPVLAPVRLNDRRYRAFARSDEAARDAYRAELREMIELLRSVTSIAVWVPFNEGWGQFDANAIAREVRELDPTRTIDHASGWHDQGGGDLKSLHVYFKKFRMSRRWRDGRRAVVVSEYGGYSLPIAGHTFNSTVFGYRRYRTADEFERAYTRLHNEEIAPAIPAGLAAIVYTQLTDVEDELNGLLSYDRRVLKLLESSVRTINEALSAAGATRPTSAKTVAEASSTPTSESTR